jgi:acyl-CoA dehydrogenase
VAVPISEPRGTAGHCGAEAQKNRYLPRLARGEKFLRAGGPRVGSDAAAIPDTGCGWRLSGQEVIGLKLNFSKRYITLAPVATVVGLAFRMFDPEKLLGEKVDIGITCALLPRDTPGITIGRRHLPLNIPFQNGPVQGGVFVPARLHHRRPADGGPGLADAGRAAVRGSLHLAAINATGGSLAAVCTPPAPMRASGASSACRSASSKASRLVLARMVSFAYIMDAARSAHDLRIDNGARPAVPAGILKAHVTELGRRVGNDAMDIRAARASCSDRATIWAAVTSRFRSQSRWKARTS